EVQNSAGSAARGTSEPPPMWHVLIYPRMADCRGCALAREVDTLTLLSIHNRLSVRRAQGRFRLCASSSAMFLAATRTSRVRHLPASELGTRQAKSRSAMATIDSDWLRNSPHLRPPVRGEVGQAIFCG